MKLEIKPGICEAVEFFEQKDDTLHGKTLKDIRYNASQTEWRV